MLGRLIHTMRNKLVAALLLVAGAGLTGCQTQTTATIPPPAYTAEDLNPRQIFGGRIGEEITTAYKPAELSSRKIGYATMTEREYLIWKRTNRS